MVTKTITFSPFARLEGDLEVRADIEGGRIVEARASGTLFRGFEAMLRGRNPLDAIVITCRICGQCGLTHSAAAAAALRALTGARVPPNASIAIDVMLGIETIISHLTHFYLSYAPDLAEPPYGDPEARRFLPPAGRSFARALREREQLLGVLGLFAGKWPNSLAIQPGGTTRPVDASEVRRAHGLLAEYRMFVEQQILGGELDEWLALDSARDLYQWIGQARHAASDIGVFVTLCLRHELDRIGATSVPFISSGGWPGPSGEAVMRPGFHDGELRALDTMAIEEHVAHSWYEPYPGGLHPFDGETEPAPGRTGAYTWAKAPRYGGRPAEAGPLARMVVDQDPLVSSLREKHGPSAFVREMARLHETLRLLRQIGVWLNAVDPEAPFYEEPPRALSGSGVGLVEAPRGTLGHWIRVEDGMVQNYQIITPTGWNLSPRAADEIPGPLEEALVGVPVPDPDRPVEISYVVKSFDPCLYCTVH